MNLDDIKAHSDEVGDCWEWRTNGKMDRSRRHPMVEKGKLVRRLAYTLAGGKLRDGDSLAPGKCGNPYCINPDHQKRLTFTQKSALGGSDSPTRGAKVAKTRRARGRNKLTQEQVGVIRASEESGYALARLLGVDEATISDIRQGRTWKNYGSPFAGLGARA